MIFYALKAFDVTFAGKYLRGDPVNEKEDLNLTERLRKMKSPEKYGYHPSLKNAVSGTAKMIEPRSTSRLDLYFYQNLVSSQRLSSTGQSVWITR